MLVSTGVVFTPKFPRGCSGGCLRSCGVFFFFFQAEDGIRDLTVTGVQTCASSDLWNHFNGLLALGELNLEQFKDVEEKINRERAEGLKRLRQENGSSTFSDAWQDMLKELEASGKDFARSITSDIGNAIETLNQQLVQFVATGKGLSLKKIGQDLQANVFGSLLKKGESSLLSAFGLGSTTKPDGSKNNPLNVAI